MTEQRSFIVDDELFEAGLDGYVKSSGAGNNIYRLTAKGGPKKGYFVTNPDAEGKAAGDWLTYREIAAFDGLKGGVEMPNGLKEFPVFDQQVVTDEEGNRRRTTNSGLDPIIALVVPGKFANNGKAKGTDVMAFNFLEEVADDEGNVTHRHIVLKMSGSRGRELMGAYNLQVETNGSFDLTAFPWTLAITGQGAAAALKLKPHRVEGPTDLPEPLNVLEMMQEIRQAVEDFVDGIRGANAQPDSLSTTEEDGDATDVFEAGLSEDEEALAAKADEFAEMTDAQIRAALKKAKVEVPPRAQRSQLLSLAAAKL